MWPRSSKAPNQIDLNQHETNRPTNKVTIMPVPFLGIRLMQQYVYRKGCGSAL